MQLLLRRAALGLRPDDADGAITLAASPDSLARAAWLWDVRVVAAPAGGPAAYDVPGIGRHDVVVHRDEAVIRSDQRTLELDGSVVLGRPRDELWLAVVETGSPRTGSFALAPGDVLVWEGDDPLGVALEAAHGPATLAMVALARLDGTPLRWVP
jgi:hypothetical protein